MPAHSFAVIFRFLGKVAVEGTVHDPVITDGPVAIQPQTNDVYDEGIARLGGFHVERAGFGVATEDAWDPFFVGATRVDGGGVDGVARCDG